MGYRDATGPLAARREELQQELAEVRAKRREAEDLEAREKVIMAELLKVEQRLGSQTGMLERVRVASPCKASWEDMVGDDRVRFCGLCAKNVYDLSAMTREEAEALLLEKEGKLCARLARRADDTIVTDDCPVGVKKKRVRLAMLSAGAGVLAAAGAATAFISGTRSLGGVRVMGEIEPVMGKLESVQTLPPANEDTQKKPAP